MLLAAVCLEGQDPQCCCTYVRTPAYFEAESLFNGLLTSLSDGTILRTFSTNAEYSEIDLSRKMGQRDLPTV